MSFSKQRLYDLLPAYVRFRDQQLRDPELDIAPLEALINALELPLHAIEENIDALYQGWFIETCDEWKVPYIADLLGVRGLEEAGAMLPGQRARVANAITYRRRKGTVAALALAAQDATGWACQATEIRDLSAVTQALGTPHPERGCTVDLRAGATLEEIDTAFDQVPRTIDLRLARPGRPAAPGTGIQPDRLGLTFWRLESYPIHGAQARPSAGDPERCFRFHPSGVDTVLFNLPRTPTETVYSAEPRHLPVPLSRRELAREIEARRHGEAPEGGFFSDPPAFRVWVREGRSAAFHLVPPREIEICDLSRWRETPPWPDWERARVAVDPETGRIAFPGPDPERQVRVDYNYGAACDLGGGSYPRHSQEDAADALWQALVDRDASPGLEKDILRFASLREALAAWRAAPAAEAGRALVRIADNGRHRIGDLAIELRRDERLTIQAGERCWPHLEGRLEIRGDAGSHLLLDGLGLEGRLTLRHRPSLSLRHCTVHPTGDVGTAIDFMPEAPGARRFEVKIAHSILTGPIHLPMRLLGLEITDSIVDAGSGQAIRGAEAAAGDAGEPAEWIGPPARIERSTLFGEVAVQQLWRASNALFTGRVRVARPRDGEARFCYFPAGSITPPRRHCLAGPQTADGGWLTPSFTSRTYGHPGYAQLSSCSGEIRSGGEKGNEIGVFYQLRSGDRQANLDAILDEYLPVGFTERITYAT